MSNGLCFSMDMIDGRARRRFPNLSIKRSHGGPYNHCITTSTNLLKNGKFLFVLSFLLQILNAIDEIGDLIGAKQLRK